MTEPAPGVVKVVFLLSAPLSERDYQRFGFELLHANGLHVEAWDLSPWIWRNPPTAGQPRIFAGSRQFESRNAALAAIAGVGPDTIAVAVMFYNLRTRPVFKALSRSQARYAMINLHALPTAAARRRMPLPALLRWRAVTAALNRFWLPCLPVRPPHFLIAAAEASTMVPPGRSPETDWIWTHALDYDLYLEQRERLPPAEPGLAVFLDEFLPSHPDYALLGERPPVTPENYFPALRSLFDAIELQYGIHTAVAVHPSAAAGYEQAAPFGVREMRRGATGEMVFKAGLVFCHCSTSVDFAVMVRKPVIFLVTDEMAGTGAWALTHAMAALLRRPVINLNRETPQLGDAWQTVDEAAYANYERLYIKKPGTPELPIWQNVANRFLAAGSDRTVAEMHPHAGRN